MGFGFVPDRKNALCLVSQISFSLTAKVSGILALLFGLSGCSLAAQLNFVNVTPISTIQADIATQPLRDRPIDQTVSLEGKVVDRVPLVSQQVYQIQDATGTIWVLAQTAPQVGDRVRVRGTVRFQSIPINGQEQGAIYLQEKGRTAL